MTPDPLELETRRRLYRHIQANPGRYLRELQRATGLAMGALEYHLGELAAAGLVSVLQDGNKRFFPVAMDRRDKPILAVLQQELPRRVLVQVLQEPGCRKAQLVERLQVPTSTLNYHLGHLERLGLLEASRDGRDAVYRLTDAQAVARLLVAYRASFLDRMVDAFLEGTGALR